MYYFWFFSCWVINRNILDWQDYINNNLAIWKTFNLNELKNKEYIWKITYWEILNIKYLTDEWYITETSPWEYKVLKKDDYFIKDGNIY